MRGCGWLKLRRLRQLEEEIRKLKKIVADLSLKSPLKKRTSWDIRLTIRVFFGQPSASTGCRTTMFIC